MILNINYKCRVGLWFAVLFVTQSVVHAKEKTTKKASGVAKCIAWPDSSAPGQTELDPKAAEQNVTYLSSKKEPSGLCNGKEEDKLKAAHDKVLRLLSMEKERLILELELAQIKCAKRMEACSIQIAELDKKIQLERGKTQLIQGVKDRVQAEIEVLSAQAHREEYTDTKPVYLKNPLRKKDNILVLSDRCIELNGVITPWKAQYIADKVQFFNNKSVQYPIFLVIGSSPGGWTEPGLYILQSISHSKAPVYVVVQKFAASMAAVIATLATRSYAYPNAVILHHHPAVFSGYQNLRTTKEVYEQLNKLWERLAGRIAKKMGISLQAFDKKLYEQSVYGDWEEYADDAQKLKWIDVVIHGVEDSNVTMLPKEADYTAKNYLEKYRCSYEPITGMQLAEETVCSAALVSYGFDYSYKPNQRVQQIGKP